MRQHVMKMRKPSLLIAIATIDDEFWLGASRVHVHADLLSAVRNCMEIQIPIGEIMLMRSTKKTQQEWNRGGTFRFLVTLRSMNDVKNAAEGSHGSSWRPDYD